MEMWNLYTKDREKTEKTMIRGEKQPNDYYHLAVHVCLFNSQGEMLVQKRSDKKNSWPNLWDFTAGGSVLFDETSSQGISRELKEELGIDLSFEETRPAFTTHFDHGFNDIYIKKEDIDINTLILQKEEVQDVKWASIHDIYEMIDCGEFVPYYKSLIELLFDVREKGVVHK